MKPTTLPEGDWVIPAQLRVAPQRTFTLTQRFFLRLTRKAAGVNTNLNVFLPLVRLGSTFPRYLLFLSHLLNKGQIPRADKERIILRVAWRLGCVYEWGHHSHMARALGIDENEIVSIAKQHADQWDRRLRVLIVATDELIDKRSLSQSLWDELSAELSTDQRVEFCMLVGHYVMVAGLINTTGVPIEPGYLEGMG